MKFSLEFEKFRIVFEIENFQNSRGKKLSTRVLKGNFENFVYENFTDTIFEFFLVKIPKIIFFVYLLVSIFGGLHGFANAFNCYYETLLLFVCSFKKDLRTVEFLKNAFKPYIGTDYLDWMFSNNNDNFLGEGEKQIGMVTNFLSIVIIPYGLLLIIFFASFLLNYFIKENINKNSSKNFFDKNSAEKVVTKDNTPKSFIKKILCKARDYFYLSGYLWLAYSFFIHNFYCSFVFLWYFKSENFIINKTAPAISIVFQIFTLLQFLYIVTIQISKKKK